ncbi:MAG: radical SAM protein, partial [Muribaculaceae bacterium]|nr:radical SAM protein [Muribaculaceae bacterium]
MQRVMFNETVFGPIHSRRLGVSLGINLLPNDGKVCSFDCLYCEAGYNSQGAGTTGFPAVDAVARDLEAKLRDLKAAGRPLDVITFSGNGEPTLHPRFGEIVDLTARLRDSYYPEARLSVLTNATTLPTRDDVVDALRRVDSPIVKLDSAIPATLALLDRP